MCLKLSFRLDAINNHGENRRRATSLNFWSVHFWASLPLPFLFPLLPPHNFRFFPNHIISSTLCMLPHSPHTFDTARVELVFWMFSFLSCRCLPPQNSLCSIVISYRTEGRPGITCDCHTLTYVVWYDDNRAAAAATAATGNECERQFSASTEKIPESEPRVWKFQLWICTWKEFNN